jgi:hypothetical protein
MRTAFAATAAALLLAAPAEAQSPRQGIANARAAGMTVDPRAEALMARAPIGTCANDPTLPGCPTVRAVRFIGHSTTFGSFGTIVRPTAHAAAVPQCFIRVSAQSPYKAAGRAPMNATDMCTAAVSEQEMYAVLSMYYRRWRNMASRYKDCTPGSTCRLHVTYRCGGAALRAWRAHADGWANLRGTWYAGSQTRYHNLRCSR